MANTRENSEIVKGSVLMLFIDDNNTYKPVAFATSHSLSVTVNTTEVSTKDHGAYPAVVANTISWSVTTENLYSDTSEAALMALVKAKTPVHIKFAKASNWTDEGIVGNENPEWTAASTVVAEGDALITSLSINAPAGDNATMTAEFTGIGALNEAE